MPSTSGRFDPATTLESSTRLYAGTGSRPSTVTTTDGSAATSSSTKREPTMPCPTTTTRLMRRPPSTRWTRSSRTAQTLNSGIPETGSIASLVSRLALSSPAQWNGRKTVSGRMSPVTDAVATSSPRAEVTRTASPSVTPWVSASTGWISSRGAGAASTSSATRRVWAPDW